MIIMISHDNIYHHRSYQHVSLLQQSLHPSQVPKGSMEGNEFKNGPAGGRQKYPMIDELQSMTPKNGIHIMIPP